MFRAGRSGLSISALQHVLPLQASSAAVIASTETMGEGLVTLTGFEAT
jgi:hypothetical protein